MQKYAYATLLATDDYINMVLALYYSYKKSQSRYPFIVIATDNLSEETFYILNQENVPFIKKPYLEFDCPNCSSNAFACTRNKFYCWSFTAFQKIMFLDADIIIRKNLDKYFDYPEGVAMGEAFIVEPSQPVFDSIIQEIAWPTDEWYFIQKYNLQERAWDIYKGIIHLMYQPKYTVFYSLIEIYQIIDKIWDPNEIYRNPFEQFIEWQKLQAEY